MNPTKAEIERALFPKRKGTPEGNTQRAILELLVAKVIYAGRLNTGSGFAGGRPVQHHSFGKGCADILAFQEIVCGGVRYGFRPLWIEVKAPGGSQSPEQRSFEEHVKGLGHYYLLAYSVDDVMQWIEEHR